MSILGYDTEVVYRRGIDAELVGWQRDRFTLLKSKAIIYEELIDRYDFDGHLFKKGNVGNICLL